MENKDPKSNIWNKKIFRRGNYLIMPRFQLGLISYFCAIFAITFGIGYFGLLVSFKNFTDRQLTPRLNDPMALAMIKDQFDVLQSSYLSLAMICFGIMVIGGIYISHKVAGPMYRFKVHFQGMAHGNPVREVKLRKGDHFQDVAEAMNQFIRKQNGETSSSTNSAAS